MFAIENEQLRVVISSKGAELQSIFNKSSQLEHMWSGDPAFWAKRSPVLFPIVGTLKDDTYMYEGKSYHLSRHGFAREMEFMVDKQQAGSISFLLKSNEITLNNFPFAFEFRLSYSLHENMLKTIYEIKNITDKDMYFSVGGHPAFKLPLADGTTYNDYYLEFDKNENLRRWPISPGGLIEKDPVPYLRHTRILPLNKELFSRDALVFKHPASSSVSIRSNKTPHGLEFSFHGFPYLGIWAAKKADFVCIEPWCGIADSVDTDQQLVHKEGINQLAPGEVFERSWKVLLF
jgi:galactose mutarotase-like enzyme